MKTDTESKNEKLLNDFLIYARSHPELRLWQALRNWSGKNFILTADELLGSGKFDGIEDTFYFKEKDK